MLAVVSLIGVAPTASQALVPYSQDFEGLAQSSPSALADNNWLVFANVFGPDWGYWYNYGTFPAPNGSGGFSGIASGEGGAGQGAQQLVVFSDYNNVNHADGAHIESLVFQEQPIGSGDVGETWVFDFEAKLGNLAGSTTAVAFIKTLNPNAGYATTNYIPVNMTTTPTSWTGYSLSITIDGSLVGQILQFGFANTATLYQGSGVFYDNLNFHVPGAVATDEMSWGSVKTLFK
jgi:hypothetical protein